MRRKNPHTTSAIYIEPDTAVCDPDWKIYFYHWLKTKPFWKLSNDDIKEILKLPKKEQKIIFSYKKIWDQAFYSNFSPGSDKAIIEEIKKGKPIKDTVSSKNIAAIRAKYFYIALCPLCKKSVNITFTYPKHYCPNCEGLTSNQKLQLRRAIKNGRKICKYCGIVPLPKKYPNRDYCSRSCQQKAYLIRKEREKWENEKDTEIVFS